MKTPARNSSHVAALLAAIGLACSCSAQSTKVGGETHWLDACALDADCTRGQCLCGVCTQGCEGDDGCVTQSRRAACFQTASPGVQSVCASSAPPSSAGICLALCATTADCPAGDMCRAGACVAATVGDAGSALPSPANFAGLDAAVDFSTPVQLPPPRTTIDGATDALVGTWNEMDGTGGLCMTTGGGAGSGWACARLVFERAADGGISGYVTSVARPGTAPQVAPGPFAPPTNPNVGYPAEVTPADYITLEDNEMVGVRYRMLDATLAAGRLTFWYDRDDLWEDWCNLETPYPVTVHGSGEYRCVPETADHSNTDLGKLALCRSLLDGPQCAVRDGEMGPCTCLDGQPYNTGDWSCNVRAACACTENECHANVQRYFAGLAPALDLSGDELAGVWPDSSGPTEVALEFKKVAP